MAHDGGVPPSLPSRPPDRAPPSGLIVQRMMEICSNELSHLKPGESATRPLRIEKAGWRSAIDRQLSR